MPTPLKVPGGHGSHSLAPVALFASPAGHAVHDEAIASLNVPTGQSWHVPAPLPEKRPDEQGVCVA